MCKVLNGRVPNPSTKEGQLDRERERKTNIATTMRVLWRLFTVLAALASLARGGPIAATGGDILVQHDFNETRFYGKWYGLAIGNTRSWMVLYKDWLTVGTMMVGPGRTSDEVHVTSRRFNKECSQISYDYQKTSLPGKFISNDTKWKIISEYYVARTDYESFAFLVMKRHSTYRVTTYTILYGRSPDPQDDQLAEFRQFSLELGIPEHSVLILYNKGDCVPQETINEPQRVQRSAPNEEEGSADGALPALDRNKEDDCLERMDPGPCLGMEIRYFYNTSSQTCEGFIYGGCLGSNNNFGSERACLQTCRTEAACRLPVAPGGPCQSQFWAFDAQQGKCITFTGCGTNANKFYLEKECNEYCGVLQDGDDEFLRLAP